jgi:glycosyltransferase involved in cell wall biosynthesis
MKFLIATGIYPPDIGGPSTVMRALAEELKAEGHEVTVITYGESQINGGIVRVSRHGSVLSRYVRFLNAFKKCLAQDTTVLATDVFSVGIPVRFALIGRKNRLIVRLGGEWMWEDAVTNGGLRVTLRDYWANYPDGSRHRLKSLLAGWVLRRAATVTLTSDMLRLPLSHVSKEVSDAAVTICNVPRRTNCIAAPHVLSDTLRVLYSGRFAPVKNMPFFCRAFKQAQEQGALISMVFVGDGPEQVECEKILKDVPHVRFIGTRASHDVENLLAEADLYVMPSLSDICPNGVLEALGCGIPCLVTKEHGLPGDVGGLVEIDPFDEDAWTDALVRFSSDRTALEELRKRIRLPAPSELTLASVVTSFSQGR